MPPSFLEAISLEELRAGGYIDLNASRFQDELGDVPVHPLFCESQFKNLSAGDYELLSSSVRLASKFLMEPCVMPWLHALFFSPRIQLNNPSLSRSYGRHLYKFELKRGGITVQDCQRTWHTIGRLAPYVSWYFTPLDTYGTTDAVAGTPGHPDFPGGRASEVRMDAEYLHTLRRYVLNAQRADEAYAPGDPNRPNAPPDDASILRTSFHLAKTLLHELCHVIKNAITSRQECLDGSFQPPLEPFFMHQRLAELARAFESVVFGGIIDPIPHAGGDGHVQACGGLNIEKWPDLWDMNGLARGRSRKEYSTMYAVPMAWVKGLWKQSFWDDVRKFGIDQFKPPRILGYRVFREKAFSEDENEFDDYALDVEDQGNINMVIGGKKKDNITKKHTRNHMWMIAPGQSPGPMSDERSGSSADDSSEGRVPDSVGVIRDEGSLIDDGDSNTSDDKTLIEGEDMDLDGPTLVDTPNKSTTKRKNSGVDNDAAEDRPGPARKRRL